MSINVYNIFQYLSCQLQSFIFTSLNTSTLSSSSHRFPATCRGPPKALGWRAGGWSFIILVLRRAQVGLGQRMAGGIHVFGLVTENVV